MIREEELSQVQQAIADVAAAKMDQIEPSEVEYIQACVKRIETAQAQLSGFIDYLAVKYKAGPTDHITPDGKIVRND